MLFTCHVACRRRIGSFDKTCKLWDANTGELLHTLRGHATEIVCLSFNPQVGQPAKRAATSHVRNGGMPQGDMPSGTCPKWDLP